MKNETIIREVLKRNELFKVYHANRIHLINLMKEFKNKKVVLANGYELTKKFKETIKLLEPTITPFRSGDNAKLQTFIKCDYGHILLFVKICFSGGSYDNNTSYCEYAEHSFTLGFTKETILNELNELEHYLDLDVVEEIKAVAETEQAQENYKKKREKINCVELKRDFPL